jgi:DNA-binding protein H-NS
MPSAHNQIIIHKLNRESLMAVDIKNLNHNQLNDLISKAQVRQNELRKEKVVKLREKVHALIKAEGYAFEDIFGSTRGKAKRSTGTVAPKYRNPANPAQTWSGRGKRPHWFNDALKAGKKEKDLAI